MREYNFRVNFKEPFDSARELREFIETLRVCLDEMNMREFENELENMEEALQLLPKKYKNYLIQVPWLQLLQITYLYKLIPVFLSQ